ncbi:immunoglobulin superfamily member 23 isoform X1 [Balaenoptera acutorostrata]|uniref:immunoglobulin superfamily member 23 isoform X1 n=1 Tax=Balaenoptera acutorostrata TaxID=9767 RepID=UPI00044061E5|nr:immunoglobulin superfamily member 23 isoform X1 [Balaenoptera acutorostrata]
MQAATLWCWKPAGDAGVRRSRYRSTPTLTGCWLLTLLGNTQGILRSELNYSVILQWVASIQPEPVLRWTFNGHPRGIGERLIIQRLSLEDLGTYVCLAENSQGMYFSQPVTIMLPQDIVDPTDPVPIKPNPTLSLSGSSAFALIVAAPVVLVGSTVFTIIWKLRCG